MNDSPQPADGNGGVPVGDIRFYQAIVPPLEDGNYTLRATQTLAGLPGAEPSPSIPTVTLQFAVRGPRFTLNPADISSYFPPPSPPTPFEGQLPHVVVSRKTLPWERLLGPDSDYQRIPWRADTGNKPIEGILADGIYSVLVGNRAPHESAVNAAFLVSLEGFGELLAGEPDGEAARKAAGGATTIRLSVLRSAKFPIGGGG